MRSILFIVLTLVTGVLVAQTPVSKIYPVTSGQKISLKFDYPDIIRVSTWDKNEISIAGTVSINNGESDQAFELIHSVSGNTLYVENIIRNLKDLPQRITITQGSEKITFKSKSDFNKYCEAHGRSFTSTTHGVEMEIKLEIKVPRNTETKIESIYGMLEVKNFVGSLSVDATYGGVDVTVQEKSTGELIAETSYGEIFSNLESKINGSEQEDFHTVISIKPGIGPRYEVESKYGNVYLRKSL